MKEIYLDYDLAYSTHLDSIIAARFVARIQKVISTYGDVNIFKRRSSGGNTHYKLVFNTDIDVFSHFVIRAALCDDRDRVYIDLKRYFLHGEQEINRLFDGKISLELDKSTVSKGETGGWTPVSLKQMSDTVVQYIKQHIDKSPEGSSKDKYIALLNDIVQL
jgi:hypothetical protein